MSKGRILKMALDEIVGGVKKVDLGDLTKKVNVGDRVEAVKRMVGDAGASIKSVGSEVPRFSTLEYKPKQGDWDIDRLRSDSNLARDRFYVIEDLKAKNIQADTDEYTAQELFDRGYKDLELQDLYASADPEDLKAAREIDDIAQQYKSSWDAEEVAYNRASDQFYDTPAGDAFMNVLSVQDDIALLPKGHPFRRFMEENDDNMATAVEELADTLASYRDAGIPRNEIRFVDQIMSESFDNAEQVHDFLSALRSVPEGAREAYIRSARNIRDFAVRSSANAGKRGTPALGRYDLYRTSESVAETLADLTADQQETFLALMPEWSGTLDELADAARTL